MSPKRLDASMFCCGFSDVELLDERVRAALVADDDELAALSGYSVVGGHFPLSTLLHVTKAPAIATVLREPRARLLSGYAFWRALSPAVRSAWQAYALPDCALRPLDEFLGEPVIAPVIDNVVCRMLLGDGHRIPKEGFIAAADIDSVASDAINALATLGYVGVLELGNSMWDGLSDFFGVSLSPIRENATGSLYDVPGAPPIRQPITLDTLDLLDARTAADAIVYQRVLRDHGRPAEDADRLRATAFAAELARVGNLIGTSAAEARTRGLRIDELTQRLRTTAEELQGMTARLREKELELAQAAEELRCHRQWLEAIQGSTSWRVTAPLRATKRWCKPRSASGRGN
jgi:hypothetical protein